MKIEHPQFIMQMSATRCQIDLSKVRQKQDEDDKKKKQKNNQRSGKSFAAECLAMGRDIN